MVRGVVQEGGGVLLPPCGNDKGKGGRFGGACINKGEIFSCEVLPGVSLAINAQF